MKRILLILGVIISLFSCQHQNPKEQLQFLNGYWEIKKVEFPGDSLRKFGMGQNIDFWQFEGMQGFRKKVSPQLDGTFKTTNKEESIQAKIEDDSLRLYYTTPYNTWKETVVYADEKELEIINRRGFTYYYSKYEPLLKMEKDKNEEE